MSSPAREPDRITCEAISDDVVADYAVRGYTLAFAEEVMERDLAAALPDIPFPPDLALVSWEAATAPGFFAVYEAAFRERPGFPGWPAEQWTAWISGDASFRPDLSWLVREPDGQPVAFIASAEDDAAPPGQRGYIIQVGVRPDRRRQGLAAALVSRALDAWRREGRAAVLLHVNVNNPSAIRLYESLGFVTLRRRGVFVRAQTAP